MIFAFQVALNRFADKEKVKRAITYRLNNNNALPSLKKDS